MCIVTISRGSYSGARAIAEVVARRLDVPCVSREVLVEAARNAGIPARSFSEVLERPPSFLERVSRERDTYLQFVRAALYQRAAAGSFVYHGHGGHHMLADLSNLLRLRIVAPLPYRIDAVRAARGLDEHRARRHIARMDRERAKWVRILYGAEWADPQRYDLVINLERLDVESAVESVVNMARSPRFAWTEELERKAANQALTHRISAELSRKSAAHGAGLEIETERGLVVIRGTTPYDELRSEIVAFVREIPGVADIRNEITLRSDVFRT